MSLINDALKRASRTPAAPPAVPEPQWSLKPVDYNRSSRWPLVFGVAVALVMLVAGWFLVKAWQAQRAARMAEHKLAIAARELPPEEPKAAPAQVRGGTNALAETNAQVVAVETPKPSFPVLKLQGVFYRPRNPSVLINKKTFLVGQKVEGAKVVAIGRESVTLEWNGETKVLTLD